MKLPVPRIVCCPGQGCPDPCIYISSEASMWVSCVSPSLTSLLSESHLSQTLFVHITPSLLFSPGFLFLKAKHLALQPGSFSLAPGSLLPQLCSSLSEIWFKRGTWLCAALYSVQPDNLQVGSQGLSYYLLPTNPLKVSCWRVIQNLLPTL